MVVLLQALVQFLLSVPVESSTYPLHREVENVLIVLLSTQLFHRPDKHACHLFYDKLLDEDTLLAGPWRTMLVQQLLSRFLDAKQSPLPQPKGAQSSGFFKSLGSAASESRPLLLSLLASFSLCLSLSLVSLSHTHTHTHTHSLSRTVSLTPSLSVFVLFSVSHTSHTLRTHSKHTL